MDLRGIVVADIDSSQFQVYKFAAVAAALLIAVMLQWLRPFDRTRGIVVRNWRTNLPLALLNGIVMATVCSGCAYAASRWAVEQRIGLFNSMMVDPYIAVGATILLLDFVAYAWHRANHRVPLLWRFHAVHHSDSVYDASTAVRFHIGELLVSLSVRLAAVLVLGLPVAGILAFEIIYAFFNFFEHGNISLSVTFSGRLSKIFVTPTLHRLHHAAELKNLNSNYGTIFSFWDRLFRSFNSRCAGGVFRVGLPDAGDPVGSVLMVLAMPFRASSRPMRKRSR